MYKFIHKNLLSIEQLSVSDINFLLDTADALLEFTLPEKKGCPSLKGKHVVQLFCEASYRTKMSFDIAAKRLCLDSLIYPETESLILGMGEGLYDIARHLQALSPDIVVFRHSSSGAANYLAKFLDCGVINAGDGIHEEPAGALAGLFAIRKKIGRIKNLKAVLIGDIAHSRLARSSILVLQKMGMEVTVSGPPTMIPSKIASLGVKVIKDPVQAVKGKDVVMTISAHPEREKEYLIPSMREYAVFFGLTQELLRGAKKDVFILDQKGLLGAGFGSMGEFADREYSVMTDQVRNGVAIWMALLLLLGGRGKDEHLD